MIHMFVAAVGLCHAQGTPLAAHGLGGNLLWRQDALNASIAQLRVAPTTIGRSAGRTYQEALETIFDAINGNKAIFC
jgi:hypothetical protein